MWLTRKQRLSFPSFPLQTSLFSSTLIVSFVSKASLYLGQEILQTSMVLIDSTVDIIYQLLNAQFDSIKSPLFLSEGVLLLGALSLVPSVSESSKRVCLDMLCMLLGEEYQLIGSSEDLISYILAGMGVRSFDKINVFAHEALETSKANYVPFVSVMAAAGALRALNKSIMSGLGRETISRLRISAENRIEFVGRNIIFISGVTNLGNDLTNSILLQCFSSALARSGLVSAKAPLLICLASALSTEIFPLRRLYTKLLDFPHTNSVRLGHDEVKKYVVSVPFKEAGAITSVFCNLYASVDVESKFVVKNLLWDFYQDIYLGHRRAALLRGREDELLRDMEKIAESAFLMVVLFALSVTKYKLNTKFSQETHKDISVRILVSFSCLEYFRCIRLPEYMDTI